ncbi:MAG: DMT family transporter [Ilumatobacteraceae bacterium]
MSPESDHPAESVTAVASEGGIAVSYVAAGSRVSPMAVLLLATSALIFSTGGLFIRKLDHPQAWQTVFWRSLSACISLSLLITWRERANPLRAVVKIGRPGWAVAAAFCVSSIGMVVALSKTSVAIVLVIFALSPLAAAVMAWFLIGERVRNYTWAAIAVTVGGVAFMVSGPGAGGSTSGALVALLIPLAFGYGTVMIRRHSEIAMAPAMLLSAGLSSLISLPFARPFDITRHDLLLLFAFGFAQLGIGLALFSIGASRLPATDVALLSMLEPIMGPMWVWIFVSEYPGVPALIGGSIVFVALALHTVYAASRAGTAEGLHDEPVAPAHATPARCRAR